MAQSYARRVPRQVVLDGSLTPVPAALTQP
jgi:hypothetical protein